MSSYQSLMGLLVLSTLVPLSAALRAAGARRASPRGPADAPGAGPAIGFQLAVALWVAGQASGAVLSDATLASWARYASWLGMVATPPSALLAARAWTRPARPLALLPSLLIFAVPVVTLTLVLPRASMDLAWPLLPVAAAAGDAAAPELQVWLWIHGVHALLCLLGALLLLIRQPPPPPTGRALYRIAVGLGLAMPCGAALLHSGLAAGSPVDLAPFGFLATAVAFGWTQELHRVTPPAGRVRGAALEAHGDAFLVVDAQGRILDANSKALEFLHVSGDFVAGRGISQVLSAHPSLVAMLEKGGEGCSQLFTGTNAASRRCYDVQVVGLERHGLDGARLVTLRDVTAQRRAEQNLLHRAHHDSLTGLANRRLFMEKLGAAISTARLERHAVALLYVDLNRFKEINDSIGHAAGDDLLRILAHRLRQNLSGSYESADERPHISRLGGDEFAILVPRLSRPEQAAQVAEQVIKLIAEPVELSEQQVWSSASIGIAVHPDHGDDVEVLARHADAALYQAKRHRRGSFEFFNPNFLASAERRASIERCLRGAIENGEFELHYQLKVDMLDDVVVGAEALLRWHSKELGSIPPKNFIPIAEDSGLIVPLGSWVIDTACCQLRAWLDAGFQAVPVSVNVSSVQFERSDVGQIVSGALQKYDLDPKLLELELTESSLLNDDEVTAICLRDLRAIGVRVALDDFGTGYSALSYLGRFPLDTLKMDRSFVRNIDSDPAAAGIASAVISMAQSLNLEVVAEGVDGEEQVAVLRQMGCDQIQGFIFGAAVPADELQQLLPLRGCDPTPVPMRSRREESGSRGRDPARVEATARPPTAVADDAYVLAVGDGDVDNALGLVAMRLNRLGFPTYYSPTAEEAVLFSMDEANRIRALLVAPSVGPAEVAQILAPLEQQAPDAPPSLVVVGEEIDGARWTGSAPAGRLWALRPPFEDSELRFVMNSALTMASENRLPRAPRAAVNGMAWLHLGENQSFGVLVSLSAEGAFIETSDPLPIGSRFKLEFSLPGCAVSVGARVVYVLANETRAARRPRGMGVVFSNVDAQTQAYLEKVVAERTSRYTP